MKKRNSLARRLSTSTTVALILFFGATGVVLDQDFKGNLKTNVRDRLKLHTYEVLAVSEEKNNSLSAPKFLREQKFNEASSGLMAFILNDNEEIWRSHSAENLDIYYGQPVPQGNWFFGRYERGDGEKYFVSSYGVKWSDSSKKPRQENNYTFIVMENMRPYNTALLSYQIKLTIALISTAAILLFLQGVNLRWGLRPLRALARDLESIEKGKADELTGDYPRELVRLTSNLNMLISSERRQRERYRNTLSDLSHSLKTPLAVLTGLQREFDIAPSKPDPQELLTQLNKQVERMNGIISFQLQRAVTSGKAISLNAIKVDELSHKIVDALAKVYRDKNIDIDKNLSPDCYFYGDENDLLEVLGNICDNACKMCQGKVRLTAQQLPSDKGSAKTRYRALSIVIEDDGPGIAAEDREQILQRGVRLDTLSQGQGIGLAVVVDIMNSYHGKIDIDESDLGGARFSLVFPAR